MTNKKISFEDAVSKLSKASEELKSGALSLEKSTEVYEESLKYYEIAKKILDETKQKIEIYKPDEDAVEEFEADE